MEQVILYAVSTHATTIFKGQQSYPILPDTSLTVLGLSFGPSNSSSSVSRNGTYLGTYSGNAMSHRYAKQPRWFSIRPSI